MYSEARNVLTPRLEPVNKPSTRMTIDNYVSQFKLELKTEGFKKCSLTNRYYYVKTFHSAYSKFKLTGDAIMPSKPHKGGYYTGLTFLYDCVTHKFGYCGGKTVIDIEATRDYRLVTIYSAKESKEDPDACIISFSKGYDYLEQARLAVEMPIEILADGSERFSVAANKIIEGIKSDS